MSEPKQGAAFLDTRGLLVQKVIELFNEYLELKPAGDVVAINQKRVEYTHLVYELAGQSGWRWVESKFGYGWVRRLDGVDQFSCGLLGTFSYIAAEYNINFTLVQSK